MAGLLLYYGRYNFHYLAVTAHCDGKRELLPMSSEASFPDGRLSFPGAPIPIPDTGRVRLRMEVKNSVLTWSYALEGEAAFTPIAPKLDASLISDECGGHAEHGSFTGAFVALACHDLNGTAAPADFFYMTYAPEKGAMDA
ncbi:MAG: glycoside hydrolase 43 family protein, partial [Alphaproteobacteria bacterium]|nr:glycoside hydrolase 43 family protein [Alphaproteobacteria bacterium]